MTPANDGTRESGKLAELLEEIIRYLRNYPFLLITIAGLAILSGILVFDIQKLKEFKLLIYGVVLIPLLIQFYIETRKFRQVTKEHALQRRRAHGRAAADAAAPAAVPAPAPRFSKKAIVSVALLLFVLLSIAGTPESQLSDPNLQLGSLLFDVIALVLAVSAWRDARRGVVMGKGLAITGVVIASILILAAVGWISERP